MADIQSATVENRRGKEKKEKRKTKKEEETKPQRQNIMVCPLLPMNGHNKR